MPSSATRCATEGCGAFLVWGDPAFYDSTLRILEAIAAEGAEPFEYEVIPGISSIQLLAARHRIPLNAIGEPVLLTTGRKIAEAFPQEHDSVVVLLENGAGLESLAGHDVEIFWGAYLGTKDEVLIAGTRGRRARGHPARSPHPACREGLDHGYLSSPLGPPRVRL